MHNSYRSPDSVNAIDWSRKARHASVYAYYKGLIALRKYHPAFRLGDADLVRRHLEFLPVEEPLVVAYRLSGHAGGDAWKEIVGVVDENGLGTMTGPELTVSPESALIVFQGN